ncbi:MAG: T9SS type A sorting domain-containing protein [Bacteroidales bacterium]|nr:T9SS type A sorting domain-containing protein [Bacteroidales bacterium]
MKTRLLTLLMVVLGIVLFESFYNTEDPPKDDAYIVIGWNDLGMHCANKDFSKIAVLPPYNNLIAQIIKVGSETSSPEILTTDYTITYEVPGNTYSVGKTNFWDYEEDLFGVTLPNNVGLTGAGLEGDMESNENYFKVDGIPLTPYTDANLIDEDPYQLALLSAYDNQNNLIATAEPVIPVSNEINCVSSGCHSSENNILYEHEDEGGFDPTDTPILCAECHSSNALGTPGTPGLESLSEVIHDKHADETNDCYKCHPGPNTQCHRGIMNTLGMTCQDCHGSVGQVAQSIANGREPWLEEPSCGATECHGPDYAEEEGKLFRQSKGHGGLYCSACHGSPHAIYPSSNERDNVQNIALQGYAGILQECTVCHGVAPSGAGPHGIFATEISEYSSDVQNTGIASIFPNPAKNKTTVRFSVENPGKVDIELISISGEIFMAPVKKRLAKGNYEVNINVNDIVPGVYLIILKTKNGTDQQKLIISR